MYFGLALMDLVWLVSSDALMLTAFAVLYGIFYGGFVALAPALATDYFGGRAASGIIGLLYTGPGLGAFVGPTVAGWAYDATQSYTMPIIAMFVCSILASLLILSLPRPRPALAAKAAA
jgi:MFS family permease